MSRFSDRREAGRILATRLAKYAGRSDVTVLALPRGGVPVAYEIARALDVPLDIFTVRKIGHPLNPELALGAIATGGVRILDRQTIAEFGLSEAAVEAITRRERREIERREWLYRGERPFPSLSGRTVILVDDGLATGASARTAVQALAKHHPAAIVVAAPVSSEEACALLREDADECICVERPAPFHGVGIWYYDFAQTTDEEVVTLLRRAAAERRQPVHLGSMVAGDGASA